MDSKTPSPEEKLLRLIRGKHKPPAPSAENALGAQSGAVRRPGRSRAGWQAPAGWLTGLNVVLGCLVGLEIVALIVTWTRPVPPVEVEIPTGHVPSGPPEEPPEEPVPSLAAVVSRPVFQMAIQGPVPNAGKRPGSPSEQAKTLAARLTLIGIVAGDPPQAILEDAQTKKTHFVSKGQGLIEGLSVEEIQENRVILDLDGEKIELSL